MLQNLTKNLDEIRLFHAFDEAIEEFDNLCSEYASKYSRFINEILQKSRRRL